MKKTIIISPEVKKIKQFLIENGISQPKVSKNIGVGKDYLNRVLCGRVKASSRIVNKLNVYIENY